MDAMWPAVFFGAVIAHNNETRLLAAKSRSIDDLVVGVMHSPRKPALKHNCRNCGAPPEPVCSYCRTAAE